MYFVPSPAIAFVSFALLLKAAASKARVPDSVTSGPELVDWLHQELQKRKVCCSGQKIASLTRPHALHVAAPHLFPPSSKQSYRCFLRPEKVASSQRVVSMSAGVYDTPLVINHRQELTACGHPV